MKKLIDALPPMIGRERELDELSHGIASGKDPTVITGPVGCGKSRLALAVAYGLEEVFPRGVHLFDCASATDSEERLRAFAELADRHPVPLSADGAPRRGLLLIDNYDSADQGITRVMTGLLARDPNLSLLVTSREAVSLYQGRIYELQPLPLPPKGPGATAEEFFAAPSTRLLAQRSGSFRVSGMTAEYRTAVTELLHDLDGLPLAIEFAAPLLRILGAEPLHRRIRNGIGILSSGSGSVSLRHSSMREALEGHYRALPVEARRILVQLGGHEEFTFDGAREIIGESSERADHFLRMLIERNFLRASHDSQNRPRFTFLNTMRTFVREKAAERSVRGGVALRRDSMMRDHPSILTPRQRQVAELVADGLTNREISKHLGIAEWTAINHVREVMRRLQCSSRIQIANWVNRNPEKLNG
ncbi:LuxR family transcriptional regulator [Thermobifida halotolerans]|uniref:LuxR family transcriptional regulator n=1 Tax=Thermobifida halotolerans TaxID=483545 RepID=A0A399FUZ9_9ACTN|nr:LuxR C-terminal-related transcriptional regulator [Thermobifida halotolerans]UOE18883.1 LuxR family transcriptional regulator [Thermobifida halotolerans]